MAWLEPQTPPYPRPVTARERPVHWLSPRSYMAKSRYPLSKKLSDVQHLVGQALGDYLNDRSPSRAEKVQGALKEAFEILLEIRSRYYKR